MRVQPKRPRRGSRRRINATYLCIAARSISAGFAAIYESYDAFELRINISSISQASFC